MTERIPQEVLDKAWRNLVRRAGALIIHAMAEQDMDYAAIGCRLGKSAEQVKELIAEFIECSNPKLMRDLSDLTCAMGTRIALSISHLQLPAQPDKAADET